MAILTIWLGVWCSVRMDLGGNIAPELYSGLSVWNIRTILVYVQCRRGKIPMLIKYN